jgi:integral membrane protein
MVPVSQPPSPSPATTDVPAARKALTFFKVMAVIVGIGLLVLVAEVVISYGFDRKGPDNPLSWWPQPHGFIFMIYVIATANLGFKLGWSLGRMVLVMLAGCVPFLSFWAERKVSREAEAQLDGAAEVRA